MTGLYIRVGIALLLGFLLVFGGCRWQAHLDSKALDDCHERMAAKSAALAATAATLQQVDEATAAAKAQAAENARYAAEVVKQADRDAAAYTKRLSTVERDLEAAKRDPGCRKQLEAPVCASLR